MFLAIMGKRLAALGSQPIELPEGHRTNQGSVTLVVAGPADPELITLKALRLVEAAEVVV